MNAPSVVARTAALLFSLLVLPAYAAHAAPPQPAPKAAEHASAASAAPTAPVNVNTASADDLIRLPGIGPARAKAIIELRGKLGGFKKLEDLMRVKGIGRATFRKLEPMMKL